MFKKILLPILVLFFISGCGPKRIEISEVNRKEIKSITLDNCIEMPEEFHYLGPDGGAGFVGGLIGGAVGADVWQKTLGKDAMNDGKSQLIVSIKRFGVDVPSLLKAEIKSQITSSGKFVVSEDEKSNTNLCAKLNMFGFSRRNAYFGSTLYPVANITMRLEHNGIVIWQDTESLLPFGADVGYDLNEYATDKEALKLALTSAFKKIVANNLSTLLQK